MRRSSNHTMDLFVFYGFSGPVVDNVPCHGYGNKPRRITAREAKDLLRNNKDAQINYGKHGEIMPFINAACGA
jgi:hypothetical protein